MKISRLRRALAVFLSAAMLIMCMPFSGITASAADDIPLNDTYAYIQPQRGTFPDGTSEAKEVMITNGKLPTGTLANNIPTREGYIFGGWYVWSTADDKDIPVDDDYTFTDNNLLSGISVNIDAYWYTDCTKITASNFGEVYIGYKPIDVMELISSGSYDIPYFYLDANKNRTANISAADWYCVDKVGSLDLTDAANCNNDAVLDSKDYYLVCTVSLENTAYRFSAQPTVAAEYGSTDYTVHSWDDKTVKISWKAPSYEVITKISDISISPDITSSSYTLAPGEPPAEFTGTAKYTTKSGKTGEINCLAGVWVEEAEELYWDDAVDTIEDGSRYIPMFAFELPRYYVPASTEYFDVEGMTDIATDTESYSCNIEESYYNECIVLTAEAITASAGSSVLDGAIEYLGDVTLTPVSGDTTGTKFEFDNILRISAEDYQAGYRYIYIVLPTDAPEEAAQHFNTVQNGQIKVNAKGAALPRSLANDLMTAQITVAEKSAVFLAKVNINYITDEDYYYTFALKVFAIDPEASEPEEPIEDEGDIIVDNSGNVGGAGTDPDELKKAVDITEAEQALIDNGKNMYIILNVEKADGTVLPEDEALTESVKGDATIGMYLDISLMKKIGELESAVHKTNEPIIISLDMPEELVNTDSTMRRDYYIIRVHEDENGVKTADKFSLNYDSVSGKYWFMTDRFSSYAIAYVDVSTNTDPDVPAAKYPIDLGTDGRVHSNATHAAAGDKITITVDSGYIAHIFSGSTEIARISGTGSFIMPANGIKVVVECELGGYMLTKARSYVYSYDSSMNYITVNATKNQKSTVTINLGKEYAGKSFVIYEGKKSTSIKVTEGTLDKNGKYTLEIDYGKNYTLVVED